MSATPADSTELTRQQLEELDALLQRMLALTHKAGVPTTEDVASTTTAATDPAKSPASTTAASMPTLRGPEPPTADTVRIAAPPTATSEVRSSQVAVDAAKGVDVHTPSPTADFRPPTACPLESADSTGDLPLALEMDDTASAQLNWREMPWLLRPLAWLTRLYEMICFPLGWLGRILNSKPAKCLLGVMGCVLLCYTAMWYLQTCDIVKWPWRVPWTVEEWRHIMETLSQW